MMTIEKLLNIATLATAFSAVAVAGAVLRRDFGRGDAQVRSGAQHQSRRVADWQRYLTGGHRIGPENAAVTILEFGDYECPACTSFAAQLRPVLTRHPNDVALVFRHWPLPYHRFAYPAARAAECAAAQGRFAAYHDLLYEKHDSLGLIPFAELARRAGVGDLTAFDSCDTSAERVAAIDSGTAAAKELGGWGTPTLLVNGLLLGTTPDSAELEQLIASASR